MNYVVRVGLAAAAAVAIPLAAHAADMRVVRKAPPPVAVYNWTGCYIGGQLGGQWGRWTADVNYPTVPPIVASRDFEGDGRFIYGGQIGCNFQPAGSTFVLGLEGDVAGVSRSEFGGEIFRFTAPATDHFNASGRFGTQASLRARLGFAFDRMLFYVAGGATWANVSATHFFIRDGDGSLALSTSTTRSGWNVGVGGEYLIGNNWTIGLEYRYTDYGSFNFSIPAGTSGTLTWIAHTASADNLRTQDLRIRFNYLFNAGPVVAKY